MGQRIIINLSPVAMHERTHKQQQGALRLMEVCHEHLHNLVVVARSYYYLRARVQHVQSVAVEICQEVVYRLHRSQRRLRAVWFPLLHVQLLFRQVRVRGQLQAHVVEALKGAHARRAHGYGLPAMRFKVLQGGPADAYIFGVHFVQTVRRTVDFSAKIFCS